MNIGLLHYSVPPVVGGVEMILAKHAVLMRAAGHNVCAIAGRGARFDPQIPFHQIPLVDSVHARVLAVKKELDHGVVSTNFDSLVTEITSELNPLLSGLDLLIAHNVCSLHKNLGLTAAIRKHADRQQRPVLILWHHDLAWTSLRYRNELHDGYPWDLIRQDWPGSIHVAISKFRRDQLAALLGRQPNQIRVVPNGVAVTQLLAMNTQTLEMVRRFDLLNASPLILLPVRITRRKNIELAIHAVAELRKHFPHVMLVITGPLGPHNITNREYFVDLKNLREDLSLTTCVHFLTEAVNGYLPEDVVYGLLRMSDLLLLPSFEEGFGLPVIEASQANVPVFCSDIEPLRELAGNEAHFFSPESDPKDVAAMIRTYLEANKVFRLRKSLRNYDWNCVYKREIEPLLQESGKNV